MKSKICKIGQLKWDISEIIINNSLIDKEIFHNTPWGVCFYFINLNNNIINNFRQNNLLNSKLLLILFKEGTDNARRGNSHVNRRIILEKLKGNGFYNQKRVISDIYFNEIGKYKFVVSPEGNNIDCHRHYETWLSGGIPIIEENELIKKKYNGLPILWTKDYSEITKDYLNKKYNEYQNKIFDYSRLFLDYYNDKQKRKIKERGNYWINKWTGIKNYYNELGI